MLLLLLLPSVAKVAHEVPVDEIEISEAKIEPPNVECNPLAEDEPVEVIFVPDIDTLPLLVTQIAFAPFAPVVFVPSVIITSPPWTKTAAFTP